MISDASFDLFGETYYGGSYSAESCSFNGCGTIFELKPDGTKTTLYMFQDGSDGAFPSGGLIADSNGNLYGITAQGGNLACGGIGGGAGCGVVFKVAPDGNESVLYTFQGGSDGGQPESALISDSSGNLYGTTDAGGDTESCSPVGCGVVFKLAPDGTETALYAFKGGSDGELPIAGLVMDRFGNLYGTTYFGGGTGCRKTGHGGCGTLFKLAPNGTETVLVAFHLKDGQYPASPLLLKQGRLYGTASQGGSRGDGVVYKVKK